MRFSLALLASLTATLAFADASAPPKRYRGEVTAPMTVIKVAPHKVAAKCNSLGRKPGYDAVPANSVENGFTAGARFRMAASSSL
jgi:hypothetical protein